MSSSAFNILSIYISSVPYIIFQNQVFNKL